MIEDMILASSDEVKSVVHESALAKKRDINWKYLNVNVKKNLW